ncbi:glycosyltransferase family 4 protein [Alkalihalobacterium chitinilyticum]|uniref:Undecaprenyl/decaprenyl-phosphate alpha-N-acetylglucosaminyl 1-phosphate transferase n=1 Tax=Alkalihalobacterium chitinilyticum TaxID=2980103 RepID=A0ABT5VKT0_9BACI|nr:MraY family glycosyltransferase [Alkalihalobacterium chitinilyticum]MDE5415831.1 undecaprenyl/decaprenyl-phosphate alpha-N-acetylglucosaminyl 1-phosphate transferase [Alkalihalobacterium chitinilyticum]
MTSPSIYVVAFFVSLLVSVGSMPFVIKFAKRYGFVDQINHRKIHKKEMPRLGGVSIILGAIAGLIVIRPESDYLFGIGLGALIIIITGLIDDRYVLDAKAKFSAQIAAALVVVGSGITIPFITLPLSGQFEFGIFTYLITVLWIVGITNSINLIDGLDGLAGGVVTIALSTILMMAIIDSFSQHLMIITLSVVLIGSTLGFLLFNFYPAKIFMGDTGSLFLGYSIAVISILGLFKSVTMFSLIVPVIILAVPISDTVFAMIRRVLNKKKITSPDKEHIHHCLLAMGYSHRTTVMIVYGLSLFFSGLAMIFTNVTIWTALIIIGLMLITIQLYAEFIGLFGKSRRPVIDAVKRLGMMDKK